MKGSTLLLFVLMDTGVSVLINLLLKISYAVTITSFVVRLIALSLIALVTYFLSTKLLSSYLKPLWMYAGTYLIGYALIAVTIFLLKSNNKGLLETVKDLHKPDLFMTIYLPYLLAPLLLVLVVRLTKLSW